MLRPILAALISTAALFGASAAQAGTHWSIGISLPATGVVVADTPRYYVPPPAPVYYEPAPVYVPAPRYVEREVYYAPPPRVVYAPVYRERRWESRWEGRDDRWDHGRRDHGWGHGRDDYYGPRRGH
ncbi:MAG TPA: hypothetical protein VIN03_08090 [Roseateles sp.]